MWPVTYRSTGRGCRGGEGGGISSLGEAPPCPSPANLIKSLRKKEMQQPDGHEMKGQATQLSSCESHLRAPETNINMAWDCLSVCVTAWP
jgi:hypothetical protein